MNGRRWCIVLLGLLRYIPVKRWSIWWIQFGTAQEALDAKHVWETWVIQSMTQHKIYGVVVSKT